MIEKGKKLQNLLRMQKEGVPFFASYLKNKGYPKELLRLYIKSGWIKRLDRGVYIESNNEMTLEGLLFALQQQLSLNIFPAAKTALDLLGVRQYVLQENHEFLAFCHNTPNEIPKFVKENNNLKIKYTKLFDNEKLGLTQLKGKLPLYLSSRERAILETVYMVKDADDFKETYELIELLLDLRGELLQNLLLACKSIKTKRLFLFLAKYVNQQWFNLLNMKAIKLGKGPREIIKNGIYNKEFMITIPKDFYEYQ